MINKIIKTIEGWKIRQKRKKLAMLSTKDLFSKIYSEKMWGSDAEDQPFYSGPGSSNPNTLKYIEELSSFIQANGIKSILDIGCGDFRVMKSVTGQNPQVIFTGVDVVPDLIKYNQEHFADSRTSFICLDAIESPDLPDADLLTIRQVLQHLSNSQISKILSKTGKYKYILITEHLPMEDEAKINVDKIPGDHIRLAYGSGVYIDKAPFNLDAEKIFEYREDLGNIPAVIRTYLVKN
jgi:SAM-dependent methyltransferase